MRKILTLLFILMAVYCKAQNDTINADCPSSTTPPTICALNMPQIIATVSSNGKPNSLHSMLLLRYGLNDKAEFRIQTDYINTISIGTKIALLDGNKIIPKTTILFDINLPILQNKCVTPFLFLLMENDFSKKFSLTYNVGFEDCGVGLEPTCFISEYLSFNLSKRINLFAENYNLISMDMDDNNSQNFYDLGISFLAYRNFLISLGANILTDYTVTFNIAWEPIKHYKSKNKLK